ncbi:MAG TPA: hypothetical protein VFZ69_15855 [Longimicrobiales bacterium]
MLVAPAVARQSGVVCVTGPAGTYTFSASLSQVFVPYTVALVGDAADGTFTLDAEQCTTVASGGGPVAQMNINLVSAPAGVSVDNVEKTEAFGSTNTSTPTITTTDLGAVNASDARVGLEWGSVLVYEVSGSPPQVGCTHTIGYWKTHAGFTGNNADVVTALLPIWLGDAGGTESIQVTTAAQAVAILDGMGSNGIAKLQAQLLGAKLSIADGASDADVAAAITAADSFLASNGTGDWDGLSKADKQMVNAWAETFDSFNNGLTGPGHCE